MTQIERIKHFETLLDRLILINGEMDNALENFRAQLEPMRELDAITAARSGVRISQMTRRESCPPSSGAACSARTEPTMRWRTTAACLPRCSTPPRTRFETGSGKNTHGEACPSLCRAEKPAAFL